jgi:K+-sensing histidine kinase KdpD
VAHVREGSAPEAIAQLAADLHADLVVVGTHGHSEVARFFLGSVADRVARLARCAVSIVRPKAHLDADDVPKIEPPCPDCLAARAETNGATMWCARHAEHHVRAHAYAYRSTGLHSAEAEEFAPIG